MTDTVSAKRWEKIFYLIPSLFIIEIFLGFNGMQLVLAGVGIRKILFALTLLELYAVSLALILTRKMRLVGKGPGPSLWRFFRPLDIIVAGFVLLNTLWIFVVPRLTGGSIALAFADMDCLYVLLLYFPVAFLMRLGKVQWKSLLVLILVCSLLLAALHIVLYVGEKEHHGFDRAFFENIHRLTGNLSVVPVIMMGAGYNRVIYPATVLLILGFYMVFAKFSELKFWHYIAYSLLMVALLATLTKSLWFGVGLSILIVALLKVRVLFHKPYLIRTVSLLLLSLVLFFATDTLMFDSLVTLRLKYSFEVVPTATPAVQPTVMTTPPSGQTPSPSVKPTKTPVPTPTPIPTPTPVPTPTPTPLSFIEERESTSTAKSNSIRIEQMNRLVDKWRQRPLVGFGYGSYVEDYVRSQEDPYSYEVLLPALLMKTGILGMLVWLAFVVGVTAVQIGNYRRDRKGFWPWIFALLALGIVAQTNPLLLNFQGMFCVLFLTLAAAWKNYQNDAAHRRP